MKNNDWLVDRSFDESKDFTRVALSMITIYCILCGPYCVVEITYITFYGTTCKELQKSLWIKAVDHSLNMDKLETSLQILNFMVRTKAIVKQPVQRSNNKLCFGKKYTVCWYDVCREVSERLPINGTKNFGPDKK